MPRGDRLLTPKEQEVVWLIMNGLRTKGIANEMGITESTIRVHVKAILRKYGVNSQDELTELLWVENKCVPWALNHHR